MQQSHNYMEIAKDIKVLPITSKLINGKVVETIHKEKNLVDTLTVNGERKNVAILAGYPEDYNQLILVVPNTTWDKFFGRQLISSKFRIYIAPLITSISPHPTKNDSFYIDGYGLGDEATIHFQRTALAQSKDIDLAAGNAPVIVARADTAQVTPGQAKISWLNESEGLQRIEVQTVNPTDTTHDIYVSVDGLKSEPVSFSINCGQAGGCNCQDGSAIEGDEADYRVTSVCGKPLRQDHTFEIE